jgi:hypothetical protein
VSVELRGMSIIAHRSGTHPNRKYWSNITATVGQLSVTESVVLPPLLWGPKMIISEKYRQKALACEALGRNVLNKDFKDAWAEIAIEWHALAARRAQEVSEDRKLNN